MRNEKNEKRKIRTEHTMLMATYDFCAADEEVQLARRLWRELHQRHDPYEGVCCIDRGEPPEEADDGDPDDEERDYCPLPRSEWCEYCISFMDNGVDYQYALHKRRSAKVRMKRAYKNLLKLEK